MVRMRPRPAAWLNTSQGRPVRCRSARRENRPEVSDSVGGSVADTGEAHQPDHLSVATTSTDGVHVLTVAGEIDHDTAPPLQRALDLSHLGTPPRVVVDMRQVTFMDSAGINLLVAAHQATTQAGGWLRLASAQDSVLRTLHIVELDTIINCYPTLRDALHG